ncbi:MAG: tetratricopeptide repeat protein [Syntrophobacteraceae bacterium]
MKRQKKQPPAIQGRSVAADASTRKQSPPAAGSAAGFLRQNAVRLIILAAITFFAYIPAIGGNYIWDDDQYVTQNHTLQSLEGLGRIWFEPVATPQYYPLVFSSFWLEHHLWGLNPAGYHVVNVLLHICVAGFLFYILQYLDVPGAWLAALVFALHPVHVETVAWITERKNVLSGLFYMSSAVFFLRFLKARDAPGSDYGNERWRLYLAGMALFICALLSKTVTCTLPVALIVAIWWKRGRITRREAFSMVPPLIVGAAMGFLTAWLERSHVGAQGANWGLSIIGRFLVAGRVLCFYMWKLLCPVNLIFNYPRWNVDDRIWWQYLYLIAAAALFLLLWLKRDRFGRGPLAASLFFAITLFPALGFVNVFPFRYSYVADHFQYLASIGPIALISAAAYRAVSGYSPRTRRCFIAAAAIVLAVLAGKTWVQGYAYADSWTLWNDTLRKNPESVLAHNNIGSNLSRQGKHQEAMAHFTEALRIMPGIERTHYNLGVELALMGKTGEAMQHYREALRIYPRDAQTLNNMGTLLAREGMSDEAIQCWKQAVDAQPDYIGAHYNLMTAYQASGDRESAMREYARIRDLDPDFPERLKNAVHANQ